MKDRESRKKDQLVYGEIRTILAFNLYHSHTLVIHHQHHRMDSCRDIDTH